jgi:hypothetical protein
MEIKTLASIFTLISIGLTISTPANAWTIVNYYLHGAHFKCDSCNGLFGNTAVRYNWHASINETSKCDFENMGCTSKGVPGAKITIGSKADWFDGCDLHIPDIIPPNGKIVFYTWYYDIYNNETDTTRTSSKQYPRPTPPQRLGCVYPFL